MKSGFAYAAHASKCAADGARHELAKKGRGWPVPVACTFCGGGPVLRAKKPDAWCGRCWRKR